MVPWRLLPRNYISMWKNYHIFQFFMCHFFTLFFKNNSFKIIASYHLSFKILYCGRVPRCLCFLRKWNPLKFEKKYYNKYECIPSLYKGEFKQFTTKSNFNFKKFKNRFISIVLVQNRVISSKHSKRYR